MKARMRLGWHGAILTFLLAFRPDVSVAAETSPKNERPKLYNTQADGKEQIAAALKTAKAEGKRVILKFGANW